MLHTSRAGRFGQPATGYASAVRPGSLPPFQPSSRRPKKPPSAFRACNHVSNPGRHLWTAPASRLSSPREPACLAQPMQMAPSGMVHPFGRRNPAYRHIVPAGPARFGQRCSANVSRYLHELAPASACSLAVREVVVSVVSSPTVFGTDYTSPLPTMKPRCPRASRCSKRIGLVSTKPELHPTSPAGYASTRHTWSCRPPRAWWRRTGRQSQWEEVVALGGRGDSDRGPKRPWHGLN